MTQTKFTKTEEKLVFQIGKHTFEFTDTKRGELVSTWKHFDKKLKEKVEQLPIVVAIPPATIRVPLDCIKKRLSKLAKPTEKEIAKIVFNEALRRYKMPETFFKEGEENATSSI